MADSFTIAAFGMHGVADMPNMRVVTVGPGTRGVAVTPHVSGVALTPGVRGVALARNGCGVASVPAVRHSGMPVTAIWVDIEHIDVAQPKYESCKLVSPYNDSPAILDPELISGSTCPSVCVAVSTRAMPVLGSRCTSRRILG